VRYRQLLPPLLLGSEDPGGTALKVAKMSLKPPPHAIWTFAYPLVLDMLKTNPYAYGSKGAASRPYTPERRLEGTTYLLAEEQAEPWRPPTAVQLPNFDDASRR
jgi:hypothetical protein